MQTAGKTRYLGLIQRYGFDLQGRRSTTWPDNGYMLSAMQHYLGAQPFAYWDSNGLHYQHQDLLGTERIRTSASGTVEATFHSLPFGDGLNGSAGDTNPSHFALTDHDLAQGSGMEHATFRELSSTTGRWQSPDPYDGSYSIFDPPSFNRYTYAGNNPLTFNDPSGLFYGVTRCQPGTHRVPYDPLPEESETPICVSDGLMDYVVMRQSPIGSSNGALGGGGTAPSNGTPKPAPSPTPQQPKKQPWYCGKGNSWSHPFTAPTGQQWGHWAAWDVAIATTIASFTKGADPVSKVLLLSGAWEAVGWADCN